DMLLPCFDAVIISEPQGFKETDVEAVYEYAKALCAKSGTSKAVVLEIEPKKALELAIHKAAQLGSGKPVVITGSFYLAGAVKRYI
ncbi:MAG: hypothetical protein II958_01210, partial [Spirochaetia bacterium]|nr:hypothetical protein [Spirochaetia bacterium]